MTFFSPTSRAALASLSVVLILAASIAEARGGRGMSFGSRGARTFSPPPVTQTAPRPAQGIERSMTQPGAAQRGPAAAQTAPRAGSQGGFFNRPGFFGGIFAGLLGAGLLGMLFGGGFFGGLSGLGSMLGLALQLGLAFFLIRWAVRAFSRRSAPALAGGPALRDAPAAGASSLLRRFDAKPAGSPRAASVLPGLASLGSGAGAGRNAGNADELGCTQTDLDEFERLLGEVQTAYGNEEVAALRRVTTPEMLSYFLEELTDNSSRGVVNRVSKPKLLSGDVAESWREGDTEYATAAMRYSLRDVVEERDTGRIVETGPGEATELWTFRRARGGNWILSAIQQG